MLSKNFDINNNFETILEKLAYFINAFKCDNYGIFHKELSNIHKENISLKWISKLSSKLYILR